MGLIFSDVDGTLLDADGRCRFPAVTLRQIAVRHDVVLASSRAVHELRDVQGALGWHGALIAEDGAVLVNDAGDVSVLGTARDELEQRVATLGDMPASPRPPGDAGRLASILLPAAFATPSRVAAFAAAEMSLVPGGAWATVTAGADKGRAARVHAARADVTAWAAIGDAPNDRSLLESARWPFVIRHREGHDPALAQVPGAALLRSLGPQGWLEMFETLEAIAARPDRHGGAR